MDDTNKADFDFLLKVANLSTARLREDVSAAAKTRSQALGEHVARTLDALEARIDLSSKRFNTYDELEQSTALHGLRSVNRFLGEMQEATDWIEKSQSSDLHLGVLYFIDQISTKLIGEDVCVPAIPDGGYGYSALSWPFKHILEKLKVPDPMCGSHPAVISYPPHDLGSTLLSALFAHEVGHSAVDEKHLVDKVLSAKTAGFEKAFNELTEEWASRMSVSLSEAEDFLQDRVDSWIAEFICDILATYYLGPSYVFAFAPTVIATGSDEFSDTHPPTALRVKHILSALAEKGWRELLDSQTPSILAWLDAISAMPVPVSNGVEALCLETAELFQAHIAQVAADHLEEAVYESSAFNVHMHDLMQFFDQRILPAQMPDQSATDRRSILLGGWLFRLHSARPADITTAIDDFEFQAFLAAAFEMSFVLEAWVPR